MDKQILHDKIYYYENVIPDFDKFKEALEKADGWEAWNSCAEPITFYGEEQRLFPDSDDENLSYLYNTLIDAFYKASKDYAESLGDYDELKMHPFLHIKRYHPDSYMGDNFDQQYGDKSLKYSMVMYLNDDYKGGEISFKIVDYDEAKERVTVHPQYLYARIDKHFDVGIKPKANSMVIFPSSAPYYHTAHTVFKSFKYMVPGHCLHEGIEPNNNGMM